MFVCVYKISILNKKKAHKILGLRFQYLDIECDFSGNDQPTGIDPFVQSFSVVNQSRTSAVPKCT